MEPTPKTLIIALAAFASLATPLHAGEIADAAAAVEDAITAQDFDTWYAANETLMEKAWTAAGLHFGTVTLATAPADGFGIYTARENNVYGLAESINIYAEPRGYGFGALPDGQNEIAFDIDLKIMDPAGTTIAELPDFVNLVLTSHAKPREFVANVQIDLNGAPAGDYTLELTFRDRYSDGSASFPVNITLK